MALFVSGKTRVVYMGGRIGIHSCAKPDGTQAPECNEGRTPRFPERLFSHEAALWASAARPGNDTMKPLAIIVVALATPLPLATALAQSTTYYDNRGSVTGRLTIGNTTTFYDSRGSVTARETRTGNSVTTYGPNGSVIGRSTTNR
jgi:hypothetical protein